MADPLSRVEPARLPVICIESRQAYQALKSLATHKTDRNDARGLAHLARTASFSKPAREVIARPRAPLADQRGELVGQRVTLEKSDPRLGGCAWGPLPARSPHSSTGLKASASAWVGLSAAIKGLECCAHCCGRLVAAIDADIRRMVGLRGLPPADDHPWRGAVDRARLCGRNRRSLAHPSIARHRRLFRLGAQENTLASARSITPAPVASLAVAMGGCERPVRGRQRPR